MTTHTRRDFLARSSAVLAGVAIGGQPLLASTLRRHDTAAQFLPLHTDPGVLHRLASHAMDVAKSAGASYADIRLSQTQGIGLFLGGDSPRPAITLRSSFGYGVRVLVDGTWGFVHSNGPTPEAMTRIVRSAVLRAREYARVAPGQVTLAAAPVVNDEWSTPLAIAPFATPILDQSDRLGSLSAAFLRVGGVNPMYSYSLVDWKSDFNVFASTDGSNTAQRLMHCQPVVSITTNSGVKRNFTGLLPQLGGYEVLLKERLEEQIKAFAEETVALGSLPTRLIDVGRYPVVLDGGSMATLIGETLSPAVELDRVLRHEVDGVGTSYLSTPEQMLGTAVTAPLVTIKAERAIPKAGGVRWDNEGVVPKTVTLIENGMLVDYLTSRSTVAALSDWYQKRGQKVESNGNSLSASPNRAPTIAASQVAMSPSSSAKSVEELASGIDRGLLIMNAAVYPDQALLTGQISSNNGLMFYVEKGKIVDRIRDAILQFRTPQLWKSLSAIGDASTVATSTVDNYKSRPPQRLSQWVTAPAGLFPAVDVVNVGRRF